MIGGRRRYVGPDGDALGNLLSMSPSKCTGPNLSVSVNAKDQITNPGFSYDNAGNLTSDGQYSYAYNAENEITSANSVTYTYDGDGLRVKKSSGTIYWRGPSGQVLEETDASGNMTRDYVFFGGRRIAWREASGAAYYYFVDAIGSTRVVTDSSGNTCFNADYYPYGQENDYATSCSPTYKFTGYEFDSETGNYYAYARYYSPRLGRFMSPGSSGGTAEDPQSLNGYSYVLNNPTSWSRWRDAGGAGIWPAPTRSLTDWSSVESARAMAHEALVDYGYLKTSRARPADPYASFRSHPYAIFCENLAPRPPGSPRSLLCDPLPQKLPSYVGAVFAYVVPSTARNDTSLNMALYEYYFHLPRENDYLSAWLDPGFPSFDLGMFFGVGAGGGGANACNAQVWSVCSL
jgi:RHS repeat-associated protein